MTALPDPDQPRPMTVATETVAAETVEASGTGTGILHEIAHVVTAGSGASGRIDAFLAGEIDGLSRSRIKALMAEGALTAQGQTIRDPSRPVKPGACYRLRVPPPQESIPQAQPIALTILHEDKDIIVIDKPAGLVVHPAPGNPDRTLVNALLHHCGEGLTGIGGVRRPGIVHRLDKDTSGVMIAAKTAEAHAALVRQFQAHSITRAYRALIWGLPRTDQGRIEASIGRNPRNRKTMAVLRHGGREARTGWRVLKRLPGAALIECLLETGRTHQIRVHLAAIGHPVIGDPVYGGHRKQNIALNADRQALHAILLEIDHPTQQQRMRFESAIPPYFNDLISRLEKI